MLTLPSSVILEAVQLLMEASSRRACFSDELPMSHGAKTVLTMATIERHIHAQSANRQSKETWAISAMLNSDVRCVSNSLG
jgi:hypothetical protein